MYEFMYYKLIFISVKVLYNSILGSTNYSIRPKLLYEDKGTHMYMYACTLGFVSKEIPGIAICEISVK